MRTRFLTKFTIATVAILTLSLPVLSQITNGLDVASEKASNAKLTGLEITQDATYITVTYTKTRSDFFQAWVRFSAKTFIQPSGSDKKYYITGLGDGKLLDKRYSTTDSVGTEYHFVMIFPPVEPGFDFISVVEPENNGFRWNNVAINNPKNQTIPRATNPSITTLRVAQSGQPSADSKSHPASFHILDLEKYAKQLKINKSLEFEYDRFTDKSSIYTDPQNIVGSGESFLAELAVGLARENGNYGTDVITDIYLSVLCRFTGPTLLTTPSTFGLLLAVKATTWQFLSRDKNLYMIIDGKRLQFAPTAASNEVGGNYSSGVRTSENIGYRISREDLVSMANATSVEMRIGDSKPRRLKSAVTQRMKHLLRITEVR